MSSMQEQEKKSISTVCYAIEWHIAFDMLGMNHFLGSGLKAFPLRSHSSGFPVLMDFKQ